MRPRSLRAPRPTGRPRRSRTGRLAAGWVAAACLLSAACNNSNPKVLESHESLRVGPHQAQGPADPSQPLTDEQKIHRLIQRVRTSGIVFIRNGREHTSSEAAAHLQSVYSKSSGPETAREFIERAANKASVTGRPYQVRSGEAEPAPAHEWLRTQLRQIEAEASQPAQGVDQDDSVVDLQAQGPQTAPAEITINDVLTIIERSGAEYVAPQRKKEPKVYTGSAFSKMLRQKWQWLGRGITEVPEFLDEIATDAFASFEPYRIRFPDGGEEELRPWLEKQIKAKRRARSNEAPPDPAKAR